MPDTIALPALRLGEGYELRSDADPYNDTPWYWTFRRVGYHTDCGCAATRAEAVAALTGAVAWARREEDTRP